MTPDELKQALIKQRFNDFMLDKLLKMVELYAATPETERHLLRVCLYEMSVYNTIMENVATELLRLSAVPVDLAAMVEKIEKRYGYPHIEVALGGQPEGTVQ